MSNDVDALYDQVCRRAVEISRLDSIQELLEWDEQTMMPPAGAEHRAEQVALLASLAHRRWTEPQLADQLAELADSSLAKQPHSDTGATIRQLRRRLDRKVKLPRRLVEELARAAVLGQHAWRDARKNDDFAAFEPSLAKMIDLKRQEAEAVGYSDCPYDALLDDYEPETSTSDVADVLAALRTPLVDLVAEISQSGRRPDTSILKRDFPVDAQEAFVRKAAAEIGFDFDRGRLDVTVHPFCCSPGPGDCRITTRYDARFLNMALFGVLHEAGHGIYEQGLRADQAGLPLGSAVSLGIHESQSRLWENLVGRSRAFWQYFLPKAARRFPHSLADVTLDDFYFAINDVRPSLIRVEADEVTYNLHILVRFELERALLDGDLSVADLPGAWNEKYQKYLGIRPTTYTEGVLQDVHWSCGLIGYFPTYTLGNLHASGFFAAANAELGELDEQFARGEFQPLREWLGDKIHREGQRYSADELAQQVTGSPLSPEPLLTHLRTKLGPLYGLA